MLNKKIIEIIYLFIASIIIALIFSIILNTNKKNKTVIILTVLLFLIGLLINEFFLYNFLKKFKPDLIRKLYTDLWTTN